MATSRLFAKYRRHNYDCRQIDQGHQFTGLGVAFLAERSGSDPHRVAVELLDENSDSTDEFLAQRLMDEGSYEHHVYKLASAKPVSPLVWLLKSAFGGAGKLAAFLLTLTGLFAAWHYHPFGLGTDTDAQSPKQPAPVTEAHVSSSPGVRPAPVPPVAAMAPTGRVEDEIQAHFVQRVADNPPIQKRFGSVQLRLTSAVRFGEPADNVWHCGFDAKVVAADGSDVVFTQTFDATEGGTRVAACSRAVDDVVARLSAKL